MPAVLGLEAAGIVTGYRASIDPARLGLSTTAFIRTTIAFDRHEAFEAAVAAREPERPGPGPGGGQRAAFGKNSCSPPIL